jgi:hypothetical protein
MIKAEIVDVEMTEVKPEFTFVKKEDFVHSESLMKRFTQLWFACYFENKLTKSKVVEIDLPKIINELITFFTEDGERIDFRRATPLLIGLNNLFIKRLSFLMRETQTVLKEMSEPVTLVKDELPPNETRRKTG